MKVVIMSGGAPPEEGFFRDKLKGAKMLIAADRGAEYLRTIQLVPDLLVGDFDSITPETLSWMKERTEVVSYDAMKDFTDTEAAMEKALLYQPEEIHLFGCTGYRFDHFLGNLGLLVKAMEQGVRATIWDNNNKIFLMNKGGIVSKDFGSFISFQGFRGPVSGFSIKGALYDLEEYDLKMGDPRTVSNQFTAEHMEITFREGILLVIQSKD